MGKVVLGIGNVLLRDEGVGCHVAHALEGIPLPDVEIIDGGTCPDMLPPLNGAGKLIIVDAVKGGGAPGQIYRFHLEDITPEKKALLSLHDLDLLDSLMLMQIWHPDRIGVAEAVIIGVEPKETNWGLELSPELQERMSRIIDAVLSELNRPPNLSIEKRNRARV